VVGLLGPNGAGKSTLIAILSTLLSPSSGRVLYGAQDARAGGPDLRRRIGLLAHDLHLYPELTARENLLFFGGLYGLDALSGRVDAALERAQLTGRAAEPVARFSRGMRQRLALERALLHDPDIILLDEPFTGLDDESAGRLKERIAELRRRGAMLLIATHDLDLVESLLDRVAMFRDGRLVAFDVAGAGLRSAYRERMGAC
jgi:ABC-type multidrug transport system ATPase subunit